MLKTAEATFNPKLVLFTELLHRGNDEDSLSGSAAEARGGWKRL